MLKKLAAAAGATALLLSATIPAFAWDWDFNTVIRQRSWLRNEVDSTVTTGGNVMAAGDDVKGGTIDTGDGGNLTEVMNVVNTVSLPCDCLGGEEDEAELYIRQRSGLRNDLDSTVMTGGNVMAAGDDVKGGTILTGGGVNGTGVMNVVNTVGELVM